MRQSLTLLCLFLGSILQSQSISPSVLVNSSKKDGKVFKDAPILSLSRDNLRTQQNYSEEVTNYDLFNFEKEAVAALLKIDNPTLSLTIPSRLRSSKTLKLVEVVMPYFQVTEGKTKVIKYHGGKHYQGIVEGDEGSVVAISIFEDEMMGLISESGAQGNLVIGKLKNSDQHILYRDNELNKELDFQCSTIDDEVEYTIDELRGTNIQERALSDCIGLFYEVDRNIVIDKGGNTGAINYVTALHNQVAALYAAESIMVRIAYINLVTSNSLYYGSDFDMLKSFRIEHLNFQADMGMLLTYKGTGGLAYPNVLCNNPKHGMASIESSFEYLPTYSWSVWIVTHEFGHMLGSRHTHDCVWNGNNTAIDGCVSSYGSCPDGPLPPPGGGTIMSYCNRNAGVGINFANGFGPQPGNVIRSRVDAADCLTTINCDVPGPTCFDGIQNGGETGIDCGGPDCSPCGGGATCADVTVRIITDHFPRETRWTLRNSGGNTVLSGGPYSSKNTTYSVTSCLPDDCYIFNITDSYGDGICCSFGHGSYRVSVDGFSVASGGQFTSSRTHDFCIGGTSCTDGVQNGLETGMDCGGPDCPACPTCSDGIQNGNETGVDCGGPDCSACMTCDDGIQNGLESGIDCGGPDCPDCPPTCDDGIQNGDETGIDCGGSDCSVCPTSGSYIFAHYFETGWDGWIDGGSDSYRYDGLRSPEGWYSIRLRDNSGLRSSMTSPTYNLSSYSSVILTFQFYAYSMEFGEDFFVMVDDGSGFTTVATFIRRTNPDPYNSNEFNNGIIYEVSVPISGGDISANTRFRFQCDASSNADQVYIDAVRLSGVSSTVEAAYKGKILKVMQHLEPSSKENKVFPNPVLDVLHITPAMDEEENEGTTVVSLINLTGRTVGTYRFLDTEVSTFQINVSSLPPGTYFAHMVKGEEEPVVEKIQIIR